MITPHLITFVVLIIIKLQYIECNGRNVDSLDIARYIYENLRGRDILIDDLPDKGNNIILLLRSNRNIDGDLTLKYLPDDRKKYVYYHPIDENFDTSDHSLVHRPEEEINPVYLMRGSSKQGETGSKVKNKKLFLPFIASAGWFLLRAIFYAAVAKGVEVGVDHAIKKAS